MKRKIRTFALHPLSVAVLIMMGAVSVVQAQSSLPMPTGWIATGVVPSVPAKAKSLGSVSDETSVPITVALKLQNTAEMDRHLQEINRPGSPSYGQFLSSSDATAAYAPTKTQVKKITDYLARQGYRDITVAPNRLVITAVGTASATKRTFHTDLAEFEVDGVRGIINTQAVSIPADWKDSVHAVLGLDTINRFRTLARTRNTGKNNTTGGPAGSGVVYKPEDFATVYHTGSITGASKTDVAIIGWGNMTNTVNDLEQLEKSWGWKREDYVPTQIVNLDPLKKPAGGDDSEWNMDAQAIVGLTGGVKSLTFYTASDSTNDKLLPIINRAVSDNKARVLNMSWGSNEPEGGAGYFDDAFRLGVIQGQTFVASSGDSGSYPCKTPIPGNACPSDENSNGTYGDRNILAVSYPASSPYVVAVGGTTLSTSSNYAYVSETAWPFSGGGISQYETKPVWQNAVNALKRLKYRSIPDVAFDADWENSPIQFYETKYQCLIREILSGDCSKYADSPSGIQLTTNGGTSLAAPLFAGAWAVLESANNNKLGFAAPILYALAAQPGASSWLHDVVGGSNGGYQASPGWDYATGWGSFDIEALNRRLAIATPGQGGNGGSGSAGGTGGNGGNGGAAGSAGTGGTGGNGGNGDGSGSTGGSGGAGGTGIRAGSGGAGGNGGVASGNGSTGGQGGGGGSGTGGGKGGNGGNGGNGSGGNKGGAGGSGGTGSAGGNGGNGGNGGATLPPLS